MAADFLPPVNDAIHLPKRKSAGVFLCELCQIRGRNAEKLGHDAAAFAIDAMTDRTMVLIFEFSAGYDLRFLR
jgi:hypothetical protein